MQKKNEDNPKVQLIADNAGERFVIIDDGNSCVGYGDYYFDKTEPKQTRLNALNAKTDCMKHVLIILMFA